MIIDPPKSTFCRCPRNKRLHQILPTVLMVALAACVSYPAPPDTGETPQGDATEDDSGPEGDYREEDAGLQPDYGDGGPPEPDTEAWPVQVSLAVNGNTDLNGFATISPGASVTFSATVTCPSGSTCVGYNWDFGNGNKGTGLTPAAVTFAAGYHHVVFTVDDGKGKVLATKDGYVAAWSKTFQDEFNRPNVEWDAHGWVKPIVKDFDWKITNNWLYVSHNHQLPGSTAIMASPLVRNVHAEVTIKRATVPTAPGLDQNHYSDMILRMHPLKWEGSFYRVRVQEAGPGYDDLLQIAIFKIWDPNDQHGRLLNDKDQKYPWNPANLPTQCETGCPELTGFDPQRKQNLRLIIDLTDVAGVPTFKVKLADPADPTKVFLEEKGATDPEPTPLNYAGTVGLTQFEYETYFDDFLVISLD
jgi:hypothetical protein